MMGQRLFIAISSTAIMLLAASFMFWAIENLNGAEMLSGQIFWFAIVLLGVLATTTFSLVGIFVWLDVFSKK